MASAAESLVETSYIHRGVFERSAMLANAFAMSTPYPHLVIDNFLRPEVADEILAEFGETNGDWTFLHHVNEKKRQLTNRTSFGPATQSLIEELQSEPVREWLSRVTGIHSLIADPDLDGSGLHEIRPGGFLNMHVDFLSHVVRKNWSRQLNLLIYLNKDWRDEYNGHFELWNASMTKCEKKIAPVFNRCVIFQTTPVSFHGHPAPLACPEGMSRKSLALYYYRDERRAIELSSTDYRPLPTDGAMRRVAIAADRLALRCYSLLKRHAGLRDGVVNRILKHF